MNNLENKLSSKVDEQEQRIKNLELEHQDLESIVLQLQEENEKNFSSKNLAESSSQSNQQSLQAGNGITISNGTISANTNILATKTDLESKQNTLTFDNTPTNQSQNPITSGGVFSALTTKQNTLTAGNNISITEQSGTTTISANFDTSNLQPKLTAGNGISINSNNQISADTTVLATKHELAQKQDVLTAGNNISISNNTISANIDTSNLATKTELNQKQDTLTAGTGISIQNNVISSTATSGLTEITASDVNSESATQGQVLTADGQGGATWQTATGGSGGMTQEQETQLSAVWNYYQSLQYDPDPTYNPQTYSDYPAGTIFKTFDSYERNLEFSSTSAEIILPTIYFVAEAGSQADFCYSTNIVCTTGAVNLLISLYVNGSKVCEEQTSISSGQTINYLKTAYGIALNTNAKNNNVYIKIERNSSGTIAVNHERIEIIVPNADIFNKISPYSVEYIGGQYYVADCSDGTAKLATIAVEDMHNIQNLQFENLGFDAEHLAVGRNTQNYNNTYFYDSTFYVYKTKKNETIVNVPATNKTYRISPTFETFDWEFAKTTNCYFMGVRKPETAKYFIYYTSGNYAGVAGVNTKFSNIESISPCKKMIADPSNINTMRIYTQITDCGEVYISFDDKKTDACNVCLGYGTMARVFLKSLTSTYNFAVDVYIKRFDKIVKYEVHMSSLSTGYVIDNITTIGSYDDFVLGANDDYFVIKNGVLEYHKLPNEEW